MVKKSLKYIFNKEKRKVWLRAYHAWQLRPHEVAPLSETSHKCMACSTVYMGNYCPRCGQSATIGRFSFKKAFLLFIDVWGMGNRGMFHTLRDLMFRPGYMIRDYLNGKQAAYFPPFKMFFLLAALAVLVQHGLTLDPTASQRAQDKSAVSVHVAQPPVKAKTTASDEDVKSRMYYVGINFAKTMNSLMDKNPAIFALVSLLLFSTPLFFFLRSSPAIPHLRYSEFLVVLVYTSNASSIYSITGNLLGLHIFNFIAILMIFVSLHQFSGYRKWRLLAYMTLTVIISALILAAVVGAGIFIVYKTL